MTPCTKEVGQTNAVGHENGVAISFLPTNSANARSLGEAEEVAPTMARGGGESGNKPSVAIAYDGYNQTAHDECTFPLRTANGSEGDDRTVKVAISFKGGQSADGGLGVDEGACQTMQSHMSALEPTVAIRTASGVECLCPEQPISHRVYSEDGAYTTIPANSGGGQNQQAICVKTANTKFIDGANGQAVAIGIGRDAFNSGKNAQMAQSFSEEVQPPITAKGPGGVCCK